MTRTKAFPVAVGDRFKAHNGEVWTVTERGLFGAPHWVISNDRRRQAPVKSTSPALMERVEPARYTQWPDWPCSSGITR